MSLATGKHSSISLPRFLSGPLKYLIGAEVRTLLSSRARVSAGCLLDPDRWTADTERLQLVQFNCTTQTGMIPPRVQGNNSMTHMLLCFWDTLQSSGYYEYWIKSEQKG